MNYFLMSYVKVCGVSDLNYSLLALPYKGGKFSMGLIKPEENTSTSLILVIF
jgi:hypothetical protein